ncbi:hypothetical protein M0Q50_04995 [bacterium]|jgi:hypothetical protein|nr:hypothetical protein [bacterium]
MKPINYDIVKIKNLIGITENPTIEDLLFEIVQTLNNESNNEGIFKLKDISLKTRVRINSNLKHDMDELEKLGYIENLHYSNYKIIKHLWEI